MIVLGWAKPHGYDRSISTPFHAVVAIGASFVTACSGRWSASGEMWTYHPAHGQEASAESRFPCWDGIRLTWDAPCGACLDLAVDEGRVLPRGEMARALAAGAELVRNAEVR